VSAERDGMFWPAVDRDAHVAKGAKLGSISDFLNRPQQEIVSPDAGIVMFVRALPSVKKGDTIASIGVAAKPR
jgi:predicted deacylase